MVDNTTAQHEMNPEAQEPEATGVSNDVQPTASPQLSTRRLTRRSGYVTNTSTDALPDHVEEERRPSLPSRSARVEEAVSASEKALPPSPKELISTRKESISQTKDPVARDLLIIDTAAGTGVSHPSDSQYKDHGPTTAQILQEDFNGKSVSGKDKRKSAIIRKKSLTRPERARRHSLDLLAGGDTKTLSQVPKLPELPDKLAEHIDRNVIRGALREQSRSILKANDDSQYDALESVEETDGRTRRVWVFFSKLCTFLIPSILLNKLGGMKSPMVQQAWREKITLCMIILLICAIVAYLIFGFQMTVCKIPTNTFYYRDISSSNFANHFVVRGQLYDLSSFSDQHFSYSEWQSQSSETRDSFSQLAGVDASNFFPLSTSICSQTAVQPFTVDCSANYTSVAYCHDPTLVAPYLNSLYVGPVYYNWEDLDSLSNHFVYNGNVVDISAYMNNGSQFLGQDAQIHINNILASGGRDATLKFARLPQGELWAKCLVEQYMVGIVDEITIGCMASEVYLVVALALILGVVVSKFVLAAIFSWLLSRRLGKIAIKRPSHKSVSTNISGRQKRNRRGSSAQESTVSAAATGDTGKTSSALRDPATIQKRLHANQSSSTLRQDAEIASVNSDTTTPPFQNRSNGALSVLGQEVGTPDRLRRDRSNSLGSTFLFDPVATMPPPSLDHLLELQPIHTIMLVTCYSESEASLRITLDSLFETTYYDDYKLLFIIADGIVTGSGNEKSTSEIVLSMLQLDPSFKADPDPKPYFAIGAGDRRSNRAKVYAGWYTNENFPNRRLQTILVAKCGTEAEAKSAAKPGNRGKRDSQLILMNFFQKVVFDDRMTPLEYELFIKIRSLTSVSPEKYEIVLMVRR